MTKIDIYSGFLGAGKTTLIKKLIKEAYQGQKVVLIENEFGEIGIDGGFLSDAGIEIKEINSGCICCSLTGDFREALRQLADKFDPDRIIIEPSGVAKLSEIAAAVLSVQGAGLELNGLVAVADSGKCKMYMKNFGEFFNDQISFANTVILSRTQKTGAEKTLEAFELIRSLNPRASIITANWDELDGGEILAAIDGRRALSEELEKLVHEQLECGGHEHEHEHAHDADEVFTSWGVETARRYSEAELDGILKDFEDVSKYGFILRAKGIVECTEGGWLHFDYTPGEAELRKGAAALSGMLCVIGSRLDHAAIKEIFKL